MEYICGEATVPCGPTPGGQNRWPFGRTADSLATDSEVRQLLTQGTSAIDTWAARAAKLRDRTRPCVRIRSDRVVSAWRRVRLIGGRMIRLGRCRHARRQVLGCRLHRETGILKMLAGCLGALLITAGCRHAPTSPGSGFALPNDGAALVDLCGFAAAVPALSGTLQGSATAGPDFVWLVDGSGRALHVLWPSGFTVTFGPRATVLDPEGKVAASEGEAVTFVSVSELSHAGTPEDPYPLEGPVGAGCYVRPR